MAQATEQQDFGSHIDKSGKCFWLEAHWLTKRKIYFYSVNYLNPDFQESAFHPVTKPPGVVIDHIPAWMGEYVGSPAIAVLPNGDYVASHDIFRRNLLGTDPQNELVIFGSKDKGRTWQRRAEIEGFWSNLFVHRGSLYCMGVTREYGHVVIRRSTDGGFTWTEPTDKSKGLLLDDARYHTAPVPMLVHSGRIWRAMEDVENGLVWGKCFRAFVMSVPVDANLLDAANWTLTNCIPGNAIWLDESFGGWLEGNVVPTLEGKLVDILRVDVPYIPEKAAVVTITDDGLLAAFNPTTGFINFPGGSKKFTIRFDEKSGYYWALVNPVEPEFANLKPGDVRNALALSRSVDMHSWEICAILLSHSDVSRHAFQYADWLFDVDDLIAVVRTAFDDDAMGAASGHDANYLTFHRFKNFREIFIVPGFP